jgi:hypothetical protein
VSKRRFRRSDPVLEETARYPTLEVFDRGRRDFLARLCAAALGTGALAAGLAGCGSRNVTMIPDAGRTDGQIGDAEIFQHPPGTAPVADARIDLAPSPPPPDPDRGAPRSDLGLDNRDLESPQGKVSMMDARIDEQP